MRESFQPQMFSFHFHVLAQELPFSKLLNVVAGCRVVGQVEDSSEPIETVSDGDIKSLSKDPVPFLSIGNDLSVASRYIQYHGVLSSCDLSAHFDIYDQRTKKEGTVN